MCPDSLSTSQGWDTQAFASIWGFHHDEPVRIVTEPSRGASAAGPYLSDLLLSPPYKAIWARHAARLTSGTNLSAVSQVLAEHLWETGERNEDGLARELKDRVSRALKGRVMTPTTLRWFIEAFDIRKPEATELWRLLAEPERGSLVIHGNALSPVSTLPRHRTVALHEFHDIGPDRLPREHRTIHVIESRVPFFDRYVYRFDTASANVAVLQGGVATVPVPAEEGLHSVDIVLSRSLGIGDTASFEYVTTFSYSEAPPPEFRRGAFSPVDNLDIRVRFNVEATPARIWWCIWGSLGDDRVVEEVIELDAELVVHRFCRSVAGAVVGFRWEWDDEQEPA
jgi:hypothetical protein